MTEGEENEREREVLTLRELIHYSGVASLSVTLSEIRHLYSTEKVTYNSAQLQTATTHTGCAATSDIITHSRYTDATQDRFLQRPETHVHCELFGKAKDSKNSNIYNDVIFLLDKPACKNVFV